MTMSMNRRHLLGLGLGAAGVLAMPRWLRADDALPDDRILVVLQLSGGNDGLSSVIPYEDDALYRVRPRTAIPKKEVIPLEKNLGLHPRLEPWRELWDEGQLGLVLGAGYPKPNRSHFKSMDIWHAGDPRGQNVGTGWLGRALDAGAASEAGEAAIHVGTELPLALGAKEKKAVSFRYAEAYRWLGREKELEAFETMNAGRRGGDQDSWLHRKAEDALHSSTRIRSAVARYKAKAKYPTRGRLGRDLSLVSALINGGMGTRVYYVETGGFDTHTGQRARHDNLMRDLAEGTTAFLKDLEAHGQADKVVVFAFSEFGRRVKENGSAGTDHGTAGPSFLIGKPVKGGLHGKQPKLERLDRNGDLQFTTDFRRVYATLAEDWLGVEASDVLEGRWSKLDLIAT